MKLHWFRRDLRLQNHPALTEDTLGVFFIDPKILARKDMSRARFAYFLKTLQALRDEWSQKAQGLLVLEGTPLERLPLLLDELKPSALSWCRDYEPYARERDAQIEKLVHDKKIASQIYTDHLLLDPWEIPSYQIFTPFSKRFWAQRERIRPLPITKTPLVCWSTRWLEQDALAKWLKSSPSPITLPEAGSKAIQKRIQIFKNKIEDYSVKRDFPALPGTSHFSPDLKTGAITPLQILNEFQLNSESPSVFLKELLWREFYIHRLFHHPRLEKEADQLKYKQIKWNNSQEWFQLWCEGNTGFPIVDAGMRQLRNTGWMHNRVRMIVASFLTKDLLIDYRWGEQWFMQNLIDGDLAANNGGWQWAASTGCDPQPYFRIFNPSLQQKRFDPSAEFIRKWIPEWGTSDYPSPCVDHAEQKKEGYSAFQKKLISLESFDRKDKVDASIFRACRRSSHCRIILH
jgi:deoxyribodipyrimidine photo-lyase